jgi:hypothetical protein
VQDHPPPAPLLNWQDPFRVEKICREKYSWSLDFTPEVDNVSTTADSVVIAVKAFIGTGGLTVIRSDGPRHAASPCGLPVAAVLKSLTLSTALLLALPTYI